MEYRYCHWGQKTRITGLPGRERSLMIDIFSRHNTIHQRDIQTDRQRDGKTDTGRQQRPRLRIASCSKKYHIPRIGSPQLTWSVPTLSLTTQRLSADRQTDRQTDRQRDNRAENINSATHADQCDHPASQCRETDR